MSEAGPTAASPLARAVAERALSPSDDPALDAAVRRLVAAAGRRARRAWCSSARGARAPRGRTPGAPTTCSSSSRATGPSTRRCARAGLTGKSPAPAGARQPLAAAHPVLAALRGPRACTSRPSVIRHDTCRRETSPRRRDHFCIGRLFQPTRILHCAGRGRARRRLLDGARVGAPRDVALGAALAAPERFDAEAYGRSALRTSMRWEVRPEPAGRADALWEAQSDAAGAGLRGAARRARRPRASSRRVPARPRPVGADAAGGRRGAARARALLPPVDRAGHRPLAQAHRHLRGLARLHRAQGEPAHAASRSSSPTASAGGPSSSSGAASSATSGPRTARGAPHEPDPPGARRRPRRRPRLDAGLRARPPRPSRPRRRAEGLELPAGRRRLPRALVHVGDRAGGAGAAAAWARAPTT